MQLTHIDIIRLAITWDETKEPIKMAIYPFYYKTRYPEHYLSVLYISKKWLFVNSGTPLLDNPYFITGAACEDDNRSWSPERYFKSLFNKLESYAVDI